MTEPGRPTLFVDRLEAVVFDTEVVLPDTASVHAAAWRRLFDEYLMRRASQCHEPFRASTAADYLRHVDGRSRDDGVAGFLASRGIALPWGDPADPSDRETVSGLGNAKDRSFIGHAGQPLEDRRWHRPGEVELETAKRMGLEDTDLPQVDQPALADDPHLVGHAPNGPT